MSVQPYILPSSTTPLPGSLTLNQFIQTVLVGISGITGTLVRPEWQVEPPKQPDIGTNWVAFGVDIAKPNANSYVDTSDSDETISQRQETLDISLSIYGPSALDTYGLLRDGFQIPTNLQALMVAKMGFTEITEGRQMPDFVGGRWISRVMTHIFLQREILRVYPIVTLLSATGTIHTVTGNEEYLLNWEVEP